MGGGEQWSSKLPKKIGLTPLKDCLRLVVCSRPAVSFCGSEIRHQEENHGTLQSVSHGILSPEGFLFQKESSGLGRAGLIVALQRGRGMNEKTLGEGTLVTVWANLLSQPSLC